MNYEDTEFYFLRRDAGILFGEEKGEKIYQRASKLYTELVVTTDYRKSQTLERQLKTLIYPVIAYYKTLLAVGYRQSDAIEFTAKAVRKAAQHCAERHAGQNRRFFPFRAFRRNIKNFMEYKFPAVEWKRSELKTSCRKISFHIDECLYCVICGKFGCKEIGILFCEYERIAFSGFGQKILFKAGATLANGHEYCDFLFFKGGRAKKAEEKPSEAAADAETAEDVQ